MDTAVAPLTGRSLFEALRDRVQWNLAPEELVRQAAARGEGVLTNEGALAVQTGTYTGRSPKDKFTVRRPPSEENVHWDGRFNQPFAPDRAAALVDRFLQAGRAMPRLYGFQGFIGRGEDRLPVALITEYAWHSLMGRHMYVRPTPEELAVHRPEFTLLYLPSLQADPERDGTRSEAVILCDLEQKVGVIGGTRYGGE